MDFGSDKRITSFEEKPKAPKSNHASMGVYIFKKDVLKRELIADEADKKSANDFGKNIIPNMLKAGCGMYAYSFFGYWKDVGTVTSLWEANMDLLGDKPAFDLNDMSFKIYSRNDPLPPSYIGDTGKFVNSVMTTGCEIYGTVINSVIGEGVTVMAGAVVENSVVMRGSVIGKGVKMNYGMVDEHVTIGDKAVIGDSESDKYHITLIGRNTRIPNGAKLKSGEIVENNGGAKA